MMRRWSFLDAMQALPPALRPDLKAAIAATQRLPRVSGKITIDPDRNSVKAAVVLKVKDGKAEFVTKWNP